MKNEMNVMDKIDLLEKEIAEINSCVLEKLIIVKQKVDEPITLSVLSRNK